VTVARERKEGEVRRSVGEWKRVLREGEVAREKA
jgi:hypothetical protein